MLHVTLPPLVPFLIVKCMREKSLDSVKMAFKKKQSILKCTSSFFFFFSFHVAFVPCANQNRGIWQLKERKKGRLGVGSWNVSQEYLLLLFSYQFP